ncbi:MAG: 1-deoxy-D-xylulose-5-phosphate reductoisomerase [Gammaproteobacteria bacterium]|nr:1-deoxy-D-xylulose-5-phosphate reductoisomerase [Gammaproteobacteria bacterium]
MIGLTILGSTGSVGISTLDVVRRHRDRFRVVALTANRDVEGLFRQCLEFQPNLAVLADERSARLLQRKITDQNLPIQVLSGVPGLQEVVSLGEVDYVMAAIVGAAGLVPVMAAVRAGKRILLANKEALVVAGRLFMEAVAQHRAQVLPIDSEHNAVFQCLPRGIEGGLEDVGVRRILLTASGGPFRTLPREQLKFVTPDQACAHPNWEMGRKISVDSATMMNKGLEVIEACWLFHTVPKNVSVVLHPQSIVHSLVEYKDGSVLGQMGHPDMRTPIAHALAWPDRIESGVGSLDLIAVARLEFEAPSMERFPCLKLAYQAMESGGAAPVVLNASNEVAVSAFLGGRLRFTDIPVVIEGALARLDGVQGSNLDDLLALDDEARRVAEQITSGLVY